MKKGSLVRIKSSSNEGSVGKMAMVLNTMPYSKHVLWLLFIEDGWKDTYHRSHLEVICEGR